MIFDRSVKHFVLMNNKVCLCLLTHPEVVAVAPFVGFEELLLWTFSRKRESHTVDLMKKKKKKKKHVT